LQQLFVELRGKLGSTLLGGMLGRQEFSDGPRQLMSLQNGPNLRRTWNGLRLYAHDENWRVGLFHFRGTLFEQDAFDERVDEDLRLQGVNASFVLAEGQKASKLFLDPFWYHTEDPRFPVGGVRGRDVRDTFGLRLWGKRGPWGLDWTLTHQLGEFGTRDVEAWAAFAAQMLRLSSASWKPSLGLRIDAASGGGSFGSGTLRAFNPLFPSKGYIAQGNFLAASNLLMFTPSFSIHPSDALDLRLSYGFVRRLDEQDAVYSGLMRPYAGTQNVSGHEVGGLARFGARWHATANFLLKLELEHLERGTVLERAGQPSGSLVRVELEFRL
jgi:hypothetical protein